MKLVFSLFFIGSLSVRGQTNDKPVMLIHYVFDSFTNGKVKLKSGKVYDQVLNYNLVTKEMIFEQPGGKYLAIAHPEDVDTITFSNRKFVPANKAFYEWLEGDTYPLFIEYTCTIKEQGAQTGFGTTNTSAATSVKSLLKDGGAYALKLPDEYQVIPLHVFYIRVNTQYYRANNEQQLAKLFPAKKQQIRDWAKKNKTNFSMKEDVALLVKQIQ